MGVKILSRFQFPSSYGFARDDVLKIGRKKINELIHEWVRTVFVQQPWLHRVCKTQKTVEIEEVLHRKHCNNYPICYQCKKATFIKLCNEIDLKTRRRKQLFKNPAYGRHRIT